MYTDFFTLTLVNYFRLNNFLYKSPPTKAAIFAFDVIVDKVHSSILQDAMAVSLIKYLLKP